MSHPIKKKDFFNGGRGVNPEDFEIEEYISPVVSKGSMSPLSINVAISPSSTRSPGFAENFHPQPANPPPLYPLLPNFGMPPSSYYAHPSPSSSVYTSSMTSYSTSLPYCIPGPSPRHFEYGGSATSSQTLAFGNDTALPQDYVGHLQKGVFVGACDLRDYSKVRVFEKGDHLEKHNCDSEPKTRQQKCSLCFNHGIIKEKKGHKWQCAFKSCECPRCQITKGRQKTMRDQQKLTRHLQKMQL